MKKPQRPSTLLDRPLASKAVTVLLFLTNFLLLYFVWVVALPGVEGLLRLISCWVLAYVVTWLIAANTRGAPRLWITLAFIALLTFVLTSRPPAGP